MHLLTWFHYDLRGPSSIPTQDGSSYYVSFFDEHTRFMGLSYETCFEVYDIYLMFHTMLKTQHNDIIKCFRCDLGGEHTFNKFCELLAADGTLDQY